MVAATRHAQDCQCGGSGFVTNRFRVAPGDSVEVRDSLGVVTIVKLGDHADLLGYVPPKDDPRAKPPLPVMDLTISTACPTGRGKEG
jgi:hypothetical protein